VLAPDSFKGTLTAPQVAAALAGPLEEAGYQVDRCPLADGGEGTADALLVARGGQLVEVDAHDPLGRAFGSSFALLGDGATAVVETAAASGLALLAPGERDPERASTRGTGELIVAAARRAAEVLVGVGGSATTDGGRGALEAIAMSGGLGGARIICLCDVRTPWELAARTFGPQKGAARQRWPDFRRAWSGLVESCHGILAASRVRAPPADSPADCGPYAAPSSSKAPRSS